MRRKGKLLYLPIFTALFFLSCVLFFPYHEAEAVDSAESFSRAREMVITSKSVRGSTDLRTLRFVGDVLVEDNFTLCSDELFVRYDDANRVEEVIATGNVRVIQGDKRLRGGRGVYNKYESKVVITEAASVMECSNIIKGSSITLHTNENIILIEGGADSGARASVVIRPDGSCEESVIYEEFQCNGAR